MNFDFWYDVAEYGNINWNGGFTPREIAENAYEYMVEYTTTINSGVTPAIDTLLRLLRTDCCNGSTEAMELFYAIIYGLNDNGIEWYVD